MKNLTKKQYEKLLVELVRYLLAWYGLKPIKYTSIDFTVGDVYDALGNKDAKAFLKFMENEQKR